MTDYKKKERGGEGGRTKTEGFSATTFRLPAIEPRVSRRSSNERLEMDGKGKMGITVTMG